jgi:hypothetical protein
VKTTGVSSKSFNILQTLLQVKLFLFTSSPQKRTTSTREALLFGTTYDALNSWVTIHCSQKYVITRCHRSSTHKLWCHCTILGLLSQVVWGHVIQPKSTLLSTILYKHSSGFTVSAIVLLSGRKLFLGFVFHKWMPYFIISLLSDSYISILGHSRIVIFSNSNYSTSIFE